MKNHNAGWGAILRPFEGLREVPDPFPREMHTRAQAHTHARKCTHGHQQSHTMLPWVLGAEAASGCRSGWP